MTFGRTDVVKQQVAAHWDRRASHFDEDIETLLRAHGLVRVGSDPLLDLVAAQEQRMVAEGRERRPRRRYVVWGDIAR